MSDLRNKLLAATEDRIESQLVPETRQNYLRIVVAGIHAAAANNASLLMSLKTAKDPLTQAAQGAVSLVFVLRRQAKGVMPAKAMVPASFTLMLGALDFLDTQGIMKIGNDELVQATHVWTNFLMKLSKITPQMLAQMTQRVHSITKDPALMHRVNLKAGVVMHAGAGATPDGPPPPMAAPLRRPLLGTPA